MNGHALQPLTLENMDSFARIYCGEFNAVAKKSDRLDERTCKRALRAFLSDAEAPVFFIVLSNQNAVGILELDAAEENPAICDIRTLAIDREAKGKGHGKAALRLAADFAKTKGFSRLGVFAENLRKKSAVGFYKQCGFTENQWSERGFPGTVQMSRAL